MRSPLPCVCACAVRSAVGVRSDAVLCRRCNVLIEPPRVARPQTCPCGVHAAHAPPSTSIPMTPCAQSERRDPRRKCHLQHAMRLAVWSAPAGGEWLARRCKAALVLPLRRSCKPRSELACRQAQLCFTTLTSTTRPVHVRTRLPPPPSPHTQNAQLLTAQNDKTFVTESIVTTPPGSDTIVEVERALAAATSNPSAIPQADGRTAISVFGTAAPVE